MLTDLLRKKKVSLSQKKKKTHFIKVVKEKTLYIPCNPNPSFQAHWDPDWEGEIFLPHKKMLAI